MTNLWISIIKPKGQYAKWLIFLTLVGILLLGTTGHFEILRQYLDTEMMTFKAGSYKISAYGFLRALVAIALIFWVTAIVSDFAENRIGKIKQLRAANRALLSKIFQIAIYLLAILFALNIIGVDLTTLTVFSGALGIGLGFGLQKISSNFISGIILLLEKSIEQDDLIELNDGTFGFIRKSSARYTLIETFDSKEIMVPNEEFITTRMINWTFTNSKGRIEFSVGVSYSSDIEKAHALILEAATEHPSCLKEPEPKCFLRNFGESSVDFILHFWIDDVTKGRWKPQSEVMFEIWRKFKANGIEIPFPQRDLHLKTPDIMKVHDNGK